MPGPTKRDLPTASAAMYQAFNRAQPGAAVFSFSDADVRRLLTPTTSSAACFPTDHCYLSFKTAIDTVFASYSLELFKDVSNDFDFRGISSVSTMSFESQTMTSLASTRYVSTVALTAACQTEFLKDPYDIIRVYVGAYSDAIHPTLAAVTTNGQSDPLVITQSFVTIYSIFSDVRIKLGAVASIFGDYGLNVHQARKIFIETTTTKLFTSSCTDNIIFMLSSGLLAKFIGSPFPQLVLLRRIFSIVSALGSCWENAAIDAIQSNLLSTTKVNMSILQSKGAAAPMDFIVFETLVRMNGICELAAYVMQRISAPIPQKCDYFLCFNADSSRTEKDFAAMPLGDGRDWCLSAEAVFIFARQPKLLALRTELLQQALGVCLAILREHSKLCDIFLDPLKLHTSLVVLSNAVVEGGALNAKACFQTQLEGLLTKAFQMALVEVFSFKESYCEELASLSEQDARPAVSSVLSKPPAPRLDAIPKLHILAIRTLVMATSMRHLCIQCECGSALKQSLDHCFIGFLNGHPLERSCGCTDLLVGSFARAAPATQSALLSVAAEALLSLLDALIKVMIFVSLRAEDLQHRAGDAPVGSASAAAASIPSPEAADASAPDSARQRLHRDRAVRTFRPSRELLAAFTLLTSCALYERVSGEELKVKRNGDRSEQERVTYVLVFDRAQRLVEFIAFLLKDCAQRHQLVDRCMALTGTRFLLFPDSEVCALFEQVFYRELSRHIDRTIAEDAIVPMLNQMRLSRLVLASSWNSVPTQQYHVFLSMGTAECIGACMDTPQTAAPEPTLRRLNDLWTKAVKSSNKVDHSKIRFDITPIATAMVTRLSIEDSIVICTEPYSTLLQILGNADGGLSLERIGGELSTQSGAGADDPAQHLERMAELSLVCQTSERAYSLASKQLPQTDVCLVTGKGHFDTRSWTHCLDSLASCETLASRSSYRPTNGSTQALQNGSSSPQDAESGKTSTPAATSLGAEASPLVGEATHNVHGQGGPKRNAETLKLYLKAYIVRQIRILGPIAEDLVVERTLEGYIHPTTAEEVRAQIAALIDLDFIQRDEKAQDLLRFVL